MTTLQLHQDEIDKLYEPLGLPNTAPELLKDGKKKHRSKALRAALVRLYFRKYPADGEMMCTIDFLKDLILY